MYLICEKKLGQHVAPPPSPPIITSLLKKKNTKLEHSLPKVICFCKNNAGEIDRRRSVDCIDRLIDDRYTEFKLKVLPPIIHDPWLL